MTRIVPAILVRNARQLRECLRVPASRFHIDIMDGKFVQQRTIGAATLRRTRLHGFIEAHLMVKNPERHLQDFIGVADLVVAHVEAVNDIPAYARHARALGFQVGMALNPATSLRRIIAHVPLLHYVLVMGVRPGKSGQKFTPSVLKKIKILHRKHPRLSIGIDGGMNIVTVKKAVSAGASVIVAGSAIYGSSDPAGAMRHLQRDAR